MTEIGKPPPKAGAWFVVRRLLIKVLVIYGVVCAIVFLFQRSLLYFPTQDVSTPTTGVFATLQDVQLTTTDGVSLKAWYWPGERPLTLVIFHGNGGDRSYRMDWMRRLHHLGYGVFIVDYRGYGDSEGSPTEEGLYRDGEASIAWRPRRFR